MKLGVLNGQLNKWQAGIAWGDAPEWEMKMLLQKPFWFFHIWCIKLHSLPEQGKMIARANYKGFRWFKKLYKQ